MTFQGRVEHQPLKRRIVTERSDNMRRQMPEEAGVVAEVGEGPKLLNKMLIRAVAALHVQNGVVQVFLACEVPEQDCFANLGGSGDVLGLGAAESVARERINRHSQKLTPAVLAGHLRGARSGGSFRKHGGFGSLLVS